MPVRITYLFHNSFLLEDGPVVLLFDLPAERFMTPVIRDLLQKTIAGKELYCFVSHSHSDHFHPGLPELTAAAQHTHFILAAEIGTAFPQVHQWPEVSLIKDDQTLSLDALKITAFPSNDLGAAFLIELNGRRIYFGGDLAHWNWEEFSPTEQEYMTSVFQKTIRELAAIPIDIAFQNTDQRLPGWAGAAEFIETVKPKHFVPMHTFGETASLQRFVAENPPLNTSLFMYLETGNTITI